MGNWINIVFVIDESGSMMGSESDVTGGFKRIVDEQRANKDGKATISLYTFASKVGELYRGIDVNEIDEFVYRPGGMTALYDGVGTAIDNIGKWLHEKDKNGEEMPSKTMFVIMTDGHENYSKEYNLSDIQSKIKEQTEVYSWEFVYFGTDLMDKTQGDSLGVKNQFYTTKHKMSKAFDAFNTVACNYRKCLSLSEANASISSEISNYSASLLNEYENDTGIKME